MKGITQEELDKKLKLHELWLDDNEQGVILDLSCTDLRGVNLIKTNLSGANLEYADLSNTNLSGTNLSYGSLRYADLRGANLSCVDLIGANLRDANLRGTDLSYGNLIGANLSWVDFSNADLSCSDLRNSNLVGSNLKDTNLKSTDFSGANTANIQGLKVFSVDNIGTFKGKVTYIPKLDKVFAGCWEGNLEEFLYRGLKMNKEDEDECESIKQVYNFFKVCEKKYKNTI